MSDSISIAGELEGMRDALADYLRGRDRFAGVPVLTRATADIMSEIESTLAKVGVVIEVAIASARPRPGQCEEVDLDVTLLVEITEDVLINHRAPNGTGKGALYLAESVLLEGKYWVASPEQGVLMPREDGILMPAVNLDKFPTTFITQVYFTSAVGLPHRSS